MILIPHLIIGAIIAIKFNSLPLIIFLALLSHYLLDAIPHIDYSIEGIRKNIRKNFFKDISKIILDVTVGLIFIILIQHITRVSPIKLATGAFLGTFPDLLTLLFFKFPKSKILKAHSFFHKKIHFLKENPTPEQIQYRAKKYHHSLRISTQIFVVLLGFLLLI